MCERLQRGPRSTTLARMKKTLFLLLGPAIFAFASGCSQTPRSALLESRTLPLADANDNRNPAGTLRGGVLRVNLDATWAGWRPDLDVDTAVSVQAFAERGMNPSVPGPLLRAPEGTEVRLTLRNLITDSTLVVHGLRAGSVSNDTFSVAPGETREITFTASTAGTYHYWGTTSHSPLNRRVGRDAQLSGVVVVDPAGARVDPRERIFVISLIDIFPKSDTAASREEIWEIAINGRSWPHTERLHYAVGDTARWRWVNASNRSHPMHLHGFHFLVTATGTGQKDSLYAADATRLAVTELVSAGRTFALEWVPRRAGNWLTHCHMVPHIVPHPQRPDSLRVHDVHNSLRHPLESMAGLVLGVTTTGEDVAPESSAPAKTHMRLLIQQTADTNRRWKKGFVLQRGAEPRPDSVEIPGAPLVVTQGEKVSITVVNRLRQPSSVHWHGIELESVFDGVAGYSGIGNSRAPLIAPGDSFTVSFTPPRAGTYMYHTHMEEEDQLTAGLYGPIIVLEPGERYDPSRDFTFLMGMGPNPAPTNRGRVMNGTVNPPPRTLKAGTTYRLRLINLGVAAAEGFRLMAADSSAQTWRLISKDGAAASARSSEPARALVSVGESYDFEWTPKAGEFSLIAQLGTSTHPFAAPRVQRFIVEP